MSDKMIICGVPVVAITYKSNVRPHWCANYTRSGLELEGIGDTPNEAIDDLLMLVNKVFSRAQDEINEAKKGVAR